MGKENNIFDKFKELDKKYYNDAVRRSGEVLKIKEEITHDIKGFLSESDKTEDEQLCSPSTSLMLREKPYTHDVLLKELATDEELNEIKAYLDRPLYERIKWTKGDYIIVFIATTMGMMVEGLNFVWRTGSPLDNKKYTDTIFSPQWFDKKLHKGKHEPYCVIDYQGHGTFGHTHRVRSRGHDLSHFIEGVKQIVEGEYRGVKWSYGGKIDIIENANRHE